MRLQDLLDIELLEIELQDGYVRQRQHPTAPWLAILNYTEKAQYEKRWNEVTLQTRGLIVDAATNQVIARPFEKFFNYGELEPLLRMEARTEVTDKLDGSLGILYHANVFDEPAIATRGSFTSEQALHATKVLRERYTALSSDAFWCPLAGWTYLFEIVYPQNRIVLDYGDLDDLVLLGAVRIATGEQYGPDFDSLWPGPRASIFEHETLAQALAAPPRPNAEGLVIRYPDTGQRVKIKQEDYVRLHKLVTGLNERTVWEHLSTHGTRTGLLESIPDEFHDWVNEVSNDLFTQTEELSGRAHAAYYEILLELELRGLEGDRREFATYAKEYSDLTPLLFQLLDGRSIMPSIWKTLKPRGETPSLLNRNEDNA